MTSGAGTVGSVRVIAGRVTEVMTAKSQYGYGYTQQSGMQEVDGGEPVTLCCKDWPLAG